MDTKIKILVAGDVSGNFNQLFQRVKTINQRNGPFEMLICVGDFFGPDENNDELIAYKNGNKHISVPTYILGPNKSEHVQHYQDYENSEICPNLTYLGRRGLYTLSSGIKVAYLSGIESLGGEKNVHNFDKEDIEHLRNVCIASKRTGSDYKGIDILITSQWPYGIQEEENNNASKLISLLCKEVKPRYHFCGLHHKHFESPPFRLPADDTTQFQLCTRFVALADVGNASKAKYIYALNLQPVGTTRMTDLVQKTTDEIPCPYIDLELGNCITPKEGSDSQKQFFYDMNSSSNRKRSKNDANGSRGRQQKRFKIQDIEQEKCWFCLASLNVEEHLVITVGEHFYLALAKGPINDYHVLIISTTHIQATALLTENAWKELDMFKNALRKFFKCHGMVVCFTERNYKTAHLQVNAIGIDEGYAWKIKHSFDDKAEEYNLEFECLSELKNTDMLPQYGPYFVAELPDNKTMITLQMKRFPIHFAREIFCSENLLNCEEKINWKDIKLSKDEEMQLVDSFRKKFAQFDFTDDLDI